MSVATESGIDPKNFNELRSKIRDWLTIIFYVSSLLGGIYYFLLKPESARLDTDFRIRTLETRINTVETLLNEKVSSLDNKMDLTLRLLKRGE